MNYIHYNPCQEHWKLSPTPEDYLWSTARYYASKEPCIIPIDDVRDIWQVLRLVGFDNPTQRGIAWADCQIRAFAGFDNPAKPRGRLDLTINLA